MIKSKKDTKKTESEKSISKKKNTKDKNIKKSNKSKYDWVALKQEFFKSEFIEARSFIQHKYSINTAESGQVQKQITGRADEKRKIKEEMKEKALENFKSNLKKQWENVFDKLEQAHVKGLEDLTNMILEQGEETTRKKVFIKRDEAGEELEKVVVVDPFVMPYLNNKDMIEILKHIKLEKGEPTEITDNNGQSKAKQWLENLKETKQK